MIPGTSTTRLQLLFAINCEATAEPGNARRVAQPIAANTRRMLELYLRENMSCPALSWK